MKVVASAAVRATSAQLAPPSADRSIRVRRLARPVGPRHPHPPRVDRRRRHPGRRRGRDADGGRPAEVAVPRRPAREHAVEVIRRRVDLVVDQPRDPRRRVAGGRPRRPAVAAPLGPEADLVPRAVGPPQRDAPALPGRGQVGRRGDGVGVGRHRARDRIPPEVAVAAGAEHLQVVRPGRDGRGQRFAERRGGDRRHLDARRVEQADRGVEHRPRHGRDGEADVAGERREREGVGVPRAADHARRRDRPAAGVHRRRRGRRVADVVGGVAEAVGRPGEDGEVVLNRRRRLGRRPDAPDRPLAVVAHAHDRRGRPVARVVLGGPAGTVVARLVVEAEQVARLVRGGVGRRLGAGVAEVLREGVAGVRRAVGEPADVRHPARGSAEPRPVAAEDDAGGPAVGVGAGVDGGDVQVERGVRLAHAGEHPADVVELGVGERPGVAVAVVRRRGGHVEVAPPLRGRPVEVEEQRRPRPRPALQHRHRRQRPRRRGGGRRTLPLDVPREADHRQVELRCAELHRAELRRAEPAVHPPAVHQHAAVERLEDRGTGGGTGAQDDASGGAPEVARTGGIGTIGGGLKAGVTSPRGSCA